MLKCILVILFGTLCIANAGRTRRTNHTVAVEVNMPWHIKFALPLVGKFEPLSLHANVRNSKEKINRSIEFMSHKEGSNIIFQNKNPLRLVAEDVIYGDLEYKSSAQNPPMRIAFNYVIKNKQFDVLFLDTEVEYDAEAEAANAEVDDYAETSTEMSTNAQTTASMPGNRSITAYGVASTPAPAPTPQQQDLDATCFSQEELIMKEAEKKYLEAQLQTALEIGNIGTRLVLTGSLPPGNNANDAISALITDKLQLPHLKEGILQARFVQQELLFEMATPKQKLEVLTLARALLQRSPYKIKSTDRDVFEVSQQARGNKLH